ncbi:MAG TPA: rhodanese-like domain-containing protein, partial [Chitinophagaceae bacterium]|nr:rhodanese-like domain-containing protein [Chitinophagaceae bacterium]
MAIERIPIEAFLQRLGQGPLIDVRSPAEYGHAHLPGAVSLPLFSDGERKIVGTLYKQEGREPAIRAGLDFFGPKMRPMVETVASWAGSPGSAPGGPPTVLVYCWRGGMRSAGVSWLLDLYGFRVYTLIGGYKRFRGYVLDTFRTLFPLRLVGGYTGSGKTELLGELRKMGQAVIDLEALAVHRGSAF